MSLSTCGGENDWPPSLDAVRTIAFSFSPVNTLASAGEFVAQATYTLFE